MTKYQKAMALHRYYRITLFYKFLKDTAYKAGLILLVFVGVIVALECFFIDIQVLLNTLVSNYTPQIIFTVFLFSESLLGLLPPEIFIAWSSKSATPWLFIFILATLSYLSGIISYFIGKYLYLIPSVKNYTEQKVEKHIIKIRKWGGFFIVIGAITPIPHSLVSMASGLINYNFKNYLVWALFRYIRFIAYALIIFKIL